MKRVVLIERTRETQHLAIKAGNVGLHFAVKFTVAHSDVLAKHFTTRV